MFDSKALPNGNLLVLTAYTLREITTSGALVRNIANGSLLTDARGVEYNPVTNDIFVTMLGDSDGPFKILRLDGTTGAVETTQTFIYADDLYRATGGRLLVGSRIEAPRIYDENLIQVGTLGTVQQMFVTQMPTPVPEPAAFAVLGLGVLALIRRRKN